ncbi:MAG: type 2 isopentenyl-diphosphate Delta-isomerase [Candidatus Helarchaeota archaeon]|nr:type 2 isopentenyl-diphosphate Delta-isomerase [Candidatus Helarchaeota archaeon]
MEITRQTENRKLEHLKICLEKNVQFKSKTPGFEEIELIHHALPELDYQKLETKTTFLGREFDYPILINAMTGGHPVSKKINGLLAQIALKFNIPIEVGSQRAALENSALEDTYRVVRDISSDIFVIGNIGAAQLVSGYGVKELEKCINMIDANALAIHLNPLQEILQKEGNLNFQDILTTLKKLIKQIDIPIIIKETGAGMNDIDLKLLKSIGVEYVDVSGAGGTSWPAIEAFRHEEDIEISEVAKAFWDWGIPTAVSTMIAARLGFKVIASGGIRTGIDIAKAIACGADYVGIALPFLKNAYNENLEALVTQMNILIKELKGCMFLTKSLNIVELKSAERIFFGKIKRWMESFK